MKLLIIMTLLFSSMPLFAQDKIEEMQLYEIRSYDPQKNGLTDLVFEVRIDNLTELLNKTQIFNKLVDIYFKVYWSSSGQYKIEVMGLPKGFQEVRDDLITLIKSKLELVIPEKFSEKFKAYTLKSEPISDGKLIRAIDTTYTLAISEIDLVFDNNARLKSLETKAPFSVVKTEFSHSPKSWSNNKILVDKIVSTSKSGTSTFVSSSVIDYGTVGGFGFPLKIAINNITESIIPENGKEKEKKVKTETSSILKMSNYEVNTGKAQRFITEGLRR